MSYHTDKVIDSEGRTLQAGDVLHVHEGAFGCAVILGFNQFGDARVARPYAYASSVGTTAPVALVGTEVYDIWRSQVPLFKVISKGRVV